MIVIDVHSFPANYPGIWKENALVILEVGTISENAMSLARHAKDVYVDPNGSDVNYIVQAAEAAGADALLLEFREGNAETTRKMALAVADWIAQRSVTDRKPVSYY
jgi:hypothetical protein